MYSIITFLHTYRTYDEFRSNINTLLVAIMYVDNKRTTGSYHLNKNTDLTIKKKIEFLR